MSLASCFVNCFKLVDASSATNYVLEKEVKFFKRLVDVEEGCMDEKIVSIGEKEIFLIFNLIKEICLLFLLNIVSSFFIYFYHSHALVLAVHNFLLISSIHFRLFPCDRIIIWIYSCDENYGKRVIKFVIIILLIHRKNILLSCILLNLIRNFDFYWLLFLKIWKK